jgi:hypothetical protein
MKIALITPPLWNHLNTILAMAIMFKKNKHDIIIYSVEWDKILFPSIGNKWILEAGIPLILKRLSGNSVTHPIDLMVTKLNVTIPWLKDNLYNVDLIIYDFFMIEANIVGQLLNIPTICSISAFIENNNRSNLEQLMKPNKKLLDDINHRYGVDIWKQMESLSDGFIIPARLNLVWGCKYLIECGEYRKNRFYHSILWSYYEVPIRKETLFTPAKIKIYCSFGTIIHNLAKKQPNIKKFIHNILNWLCNWIDQNNNISLIISCVDDYTWKNKNIQIFQFVPQKEILHHADLFITHGGCNSVNEAIVSKTPVLVIPFAEDQNQLGKIIMNCDAGLTFLLDDLMKDDAEIYNRKSLTPKNFINSISEILFDAPQKYIDGITRCHDDFILYSTPLDKLNKTIDFWITHQSPLQNWNEGDLLYGANMDQMLMSKMVNGDDFFKIGEFSEFHHLFLDHDDRYPRLIKEYHNIITNKRNYREFNESKINTKWSQRLCEYRQYLLANKEYCEPIGILPFPDDVSQTDIDLTLWNMCLCGIDFFVIKKKSKIHFIIGDYDKTKNKATALELNYIKQYYQDPVFQTQIIFYKLNKKINQIMLVNPIKYNWFE